MTSSRKYYKWPSVIEEGNFHRKMAEPSGGRPGGRRPPEKIESLLLNRIINIYLSIEPSKVIMSSSNTPDINFSFSHLVENPKGLNPPGQDEIAVLKSQVESLQNELKKMKIDLLQRDEMIDELLKDNTKHSNEIHLLKYKYHGLQVPKQPISYVHCPFSYEDIAVDPPEEEDCFPGFPMVKRDEEERIERQNDKARCHGISERHLS